jgi:hypothetical protein
LPAKSPLINLVDQFVYLDDNFEAEHSLENIRQPEMNSKNILTKFAVEQEIINAFSKSL